MPQQDRLSDQALLRLLDSDDDLSWLTAAEKSRMVSLGQPKPTMTAEHPHARVGRQVLGAAKGVGHALASIPSSIYQTVTDPIGTVSGMLEAQGRLGLEAKTAFDKGDYFRAAVKGAEYLLPVVGPMMSEAGDKMERGDIGEGIGELAMNAYLSAAPFGPKAAPKVKPPILKPPTNAVDAAAVSFAKQRGIPLDAGTASGSNFLKTVQEKVGNTYGGARTAEALKDTQAQQLTRVGGELASETGAAVTNPVAAGEAVRAAIENAIRRDHGIANTAYTTVKDAQATMPVTGFKKAAQPMYQALLRESELGPLMGGKKHALVALDRIMNGPDVALLSDVDAALGDFKSLARGASMPELRTSGQGVMANAVQMLDAQVRAAASKAGPDVLKALEQGRAATKAKYVKADVLDMLSAEPGQVFRQLTQAKDVGLDRLRAVQQVAPKEIPNVARAFLEDMLEQATAEGGFGHADRLWANWQKLGGETKRLLFPKEGQIADLNNFFLAAKRINEVKNPSGTAKVAGVLDVATGIPSWALSKILLTPNGVKFLTQARTVSRSSAPAAKAVALSNLSKAAQSAGVPLDAIPAFAGDNQPSTPSETRRTGSPR